MVTTPEWWFSTVFVAILVGAVVNHGRTWLRQAAAAASRPVARFLVKSFDASAERVALMAENPALLVAGHVRVTTHFIYFLVLLAGTLLLPALQLLFQHFPSAYPLFHLLGPPRPGSPTASLIFQTACFTMMVIAQWRLVSMVEECRAARARAERAALERMRAKRFAEKARAAAEKGAGI